MDVAREMLDEKQRRLLNEDDLARDILEECRVQLMLKFRFLDLALWRMDVNPMRVGASYPLASDAQRVVFDPPRVIARFQESFEESVRDYLHLIMHCIFCHPFDTGHDNREAWDLTCDMVVESAIMGMCGSRFESVDDAARHQALSELRMQTGSLLPSKVYALVRGMVLSPDGKQFRGMGRNTLNEWHALFERDDHGAWPAYNDGKNQGRDTDDGRDEVSRDDDNPDVELDNLRTEAPGDSQPSDADSQNNATTERTEPTQNCDDEAGHEEATSDDAADEQGSNRDGDTDAAHAAEDWQDISKQIEMNLETFSKEWGDTAGALMANLAYANRAVYDYSDFLRRFMVTAEETKLNMDEFDYLYYTYGMDLYGNMPFIEPLEYKETKRVRDFAIVIDTSESVSGDLVKKFVGHTFGILKSSESYASDVNIHVVQCDAKVQCDTIIKNLRDVDNMLDTLQIRGFGGTDFRPAFEYVSMLCKTGELVNMKGLVYFTDGMGTFPEKPPAYDTAFVFMDEEGTKPPPVPPWACGIVVDDARINEYKV